MDHNRLQMLYQKTDFNHHHICQIKGIFKCCKCKKNNSLLVQNNETVQFCLFCGMPNNISKNIDIIKNIR